MMTPFGADLLSTIAEPDRIGAEIYTLDLPLQVPPVGSLKNVDLRLLGIRPFPFCKGGGVESYPLGSLGGEGHVIVFTTKGVDGISAGRTGGRNISRFSGGRWIIVWIARTNLALAVDE